MDARQARRCIEGAGVARDGGHPRDQVAACPSIETAADLAREPQTTLVVVDTEDERAQVPMRDAARLPASDDELLLRPVLDLEPGMRTTPRLVPARPPLGHDALEPLRLDRGEEGFALALDVPGVADERVVAQDGAQPDLAFVERDVEHRLAVEEEEVEDLVDDGHRDVAALLEAGPRLEQRERRSAGLVERDDLAVDDGLLRVDPVRWCRREVREVARGVAAIPGPQPRLAAADDRLDTIAIPLDLEEPVVIAERSLRKGRRHRRDEVGHRDARMARARHAPRVPLHGAVDCRP